MASQGNGYRKEIKMVRVEDVKTWLSEVQHPAKGDRSIVELGMVENITVEDGTVAVTLAFRKHRDPLADYLVGSTRAAVIRNAPQGTAVQVNTIIKEESAPKKKPGLDLGTEELQDVKHIVGIASGKGGDLILPLRDHQIGHHRLQHMLIRAGGVRVAHGDGVVCLCGANAVRDDPVPGKIAAADDVAGSQGADRNAHGGEKTLLIAVGGDVRAGFGVGIRVITVQRLVLSIAFFPLLVLINLVRGNNDH